jgi:hypothetical protein
MLRATLLLLPARMLRASVLLRFGCGVPSGMLFRGRIQR